MIGIPSLLDFTKNPVYIIFMFVSFLGGRARLYRYIACIFLIILFGCESSSAQRSSLGKGQQNYSLKGYFEPGFRLSVTNSGDVRTSTFILTERIRANLRGYILDRRIFTFNLGSNLIYNDTWVSVLGSTSKSSSRYLAPYNFSCTILPIGRHPLSLFSSFDRNFNLAGSASESHTDFQVNGATLSLNYTTIPRLTITTSRASITSKSLLNPQELRRDFFEITANQSWEEKAQLKMIYRIEDENDFENGSKNFTRSLRVDGQTGISQPLLINGVIDYNKINFLETITAYTRLRYRPNKKIYANLGLNFGEEREISRISRRQGVTFSAQNWVSQTLQLNLDFISRRSISQTPEQPMADNSDLSLRAGYYLTKTPGKYRLTNSYIFGYGYHSRTDTASGQSIFNNVTVGVSRNIFRQVEFSNFYSFTKTDANYQGGTSSTSHRFTTSLRGRPSRRVDLQTRLEFIHLKSTTGDLINKKETYFAELRSNIYLSRTWATIFGLNYRYHKDNLDRNLISLFARVRFSPTNQLKGSWNLTYSRETIENSSEWVGDYVLEYSYRTITIFMNWKMRYFSQERKSTNNDIYVRIRRNFDFRLK